MMKSTKIKGAALAAAVALTFVTVPSHSFAASGQYQWVKCYGINQCRGQSTCRLTTHECRVLNQCKGQNACRGKGFVWKTPENCKAAGGSAPETPERMSD